MVRWVGGVDGMGRWVGGVDGMGRWCRWNGAMGGGCGEDERPEDDGTEERDYS